MIAALFVIKDGPYFGLKGVDSSDIKKTQEEIKKNVICSYQWVEKLKYRYPKRSVLGDRNCPPDEMFYWNKKGIMRTVFLNDGTVWESEMKPCELLDGIMASTGFLLRLR